MKKLNCNICDGCLKVIHNFFYYKGKEFCSFECSQDGRIVHKECGHSPFFGWSVDDSEECPDCKFITII